MFSLKDVVFAILLILHHLYLASGAKMMWGEQVHCMGKKSSGGVDCSNNCISQNKVNLTVEASTVGNMLIDYIHDGGISFNENGSSHASWNYQSHPLMNADDITITLYSWDKMKNMGKAISGCCSVPLASNGCNISAECVPQRFTFISVSYNNVNLMKKMEIPQFPYCSGQRPSVRYFSICVNGSTPWRKRYNCECAVYDSVTGRFEPGNHTSQLEKESEEGGLWYFDHEPKQYQVCMFSMSKDEVINRGTMANDSMVLDSVAFNRDVFYMNGFLGRNGSLLDELNGKSVECTLKTFKGADMFNISALDLPSDEQKQRNNDSFTCLVPWPNGTEQVVAQGAHVKCMPQNKTYHKSHVYTKKMKTSNNFVSAMVVLIPSFSSVVALALICFLGCILRRKLNKFIKETKIVPKELDTVMRESLQDFPKTESSSCDEKEEWQAFDSEERKRVLDLRNHKENTHSNVKVASPHNMLHLNMYEKNQRHFEIITEMEIANHKNSLAGEETGVKYSPNSFRKVEKSGDNFVKCSDCDHPLPSPKQMQLENDSGCHPSIHNTNSQCCHCDNKSTTSLEMTYCLQHVPKNEEVFTDTPPSEIEGHAEQIKNEVPNGGYWPKTAFQDLDSPDRLSHYSYDTGCGSEYEEEDCIPELKDKCDSKRQRFVKTTSKDSGVLTEDSCLHSCRSPISSISEHVKPDFSPPSNAFKTHPRLIEIV